MIWQDEKARSLRGMHRHYTHNHNMVYKDMYCAKVGGTSKRNALEPIANVPIMILICDLDTHLCPTVAFGTSNTTYDMMHKGSPVSRIWIFCREIAPWLRL